MIGAVKLAGGNELLSRMVKYFYGSLVKLPVKYFYSILNTLPALEADTTRSTLTEWKYMGQYIWAHNEILIKPKQRRQ